MGILVNPVVLLILLPAVVLWAIPKTRRSAGGTVTAWKTVPFGCATMLVLPNVVMIILSLPEKIFRLPESRLVDVLLTFISVIVGVAVGIRVIVLLKNYVRKHYGTDETPGSNRPYYLAFGCLALGVTVLIFGAFVWFLSPGSMLQGTKSWRAYHVVTEHGTELAFQECPIHPFLAEYEYRFRFRKDGEETFQELWINTGGRTFFNVFRLKDGRLFFSDKVNDYIVDMKTRKVFLVEKFENRSYAGLLPAGKFESFGIVTGSGEKSSKMYFRVNDTRVEAEPVSDRLEGMTYFGCITNGFYPAAEKPYEPVKKLR